MVSFRCGFFEILFFSFKICKDDCLPDKLCLSCFQSLRFIYKFREKSLRSQKILKSEASAMNKHPTEQNEPIERLVKVIHLKPIPKPVPKPTKWLSYEEAYNIDENAENYDGVQCEICGEMFEKYKPFEYHLNRHHGKWIFVNSMMNGMNEMNFRCKTICMHGDILRQNLLFATKPQKSHSQRPLDWT